MPLNTNALPGIPELRSDFEYNYLLGTIARKPSMKSAVSFTAAQGYGTVSYKGRLLMAARLAVVLHTGRWPDPAEQVRHKDGNRRNLAWANLLVVPVGSRPPRAPRTQTVQDKLANKKELALIDQQLDALEDCRLQLHQQLELVASQVNTLRAQRDKLDQPTPYTLAERRRLRYI